MDPGLRKCLRVKEIEHFRQHVGGAFDQLGAFADQFMTAARERAVDGAGDREYLAALLECVMRGDE